MLRYQWRLRFFSVGFATLLTLRPGNASSGGTDLQALRSHIGGEIDASQVQSIRFYFNPPVSRFHEGDQPNGPVLYYDDMRLIQEEEP